MRQSQSSPHDLLLRNVTALVVVLGDAPKEFCMLPSTDHVSKVLIMCDDNQLEIVLLPPRCHDSSQGICQASTVFCGSSRAGSRCVQQLEGLMTCGQLRKLQEHSQLVMLCVYVQANYTTFLYQIVCHNMHGLHHASFIMWHY